MEILKKGDSGIMVEKLQRYLGITIDGQFGNSTEEAVKEYQNKHGLTVDGIVGIYLWEILQEGGNNE